MYSEEVLPGETEEISLTGLGQPARYGEEVLPGETPIVEGEVVSVSGEADGAYASEGADSWRRSWEKRMVLARAVSNQIWYIEKHDGSRYVQHNHADGTYEAYVKGSATHIIDRGRYSMVNGQYSEANFEGSHGTLQNDGTSVWIDHYAGVHGYHKYIATSDQYIGGIKVPPPPFPTGTWRGKWQTICCGCCPVDSGGDDLKLAFHENGTITGGATDPRNGSFKVSGTWSRDSVGSYKVKYTYSAPGNGNDGETAHGWVRGDRMETDWTNSSCSGKAQYDYDGVDGQEMERET